MTPSGIKQLIDFLIDVLSILASFWEPAWCHVGSFFRPKTAWEASKTPPRRFQDGPRRYQKRPGWPKMAQDAFKPAPEPSRPRFWCLGTWVLMAFWLNADPFLDGFGIIFTMQIPSRLHVIEASKGFSMIEFLKNFQFVQPFGEKYGRNCLLFWIYNSIKYSMSQGACWTSQHAPVRSRHGPRAPQNVSRGIAEIYFEALSVHLFRFVLQIPRALP